jgi:hypothetical protein
MTAFFKSKSGASIIIALIIMILLLAIGTSVLIAATSSANNATNLLNSKKLYYFARSVADTVTEDIVGENGVLGNYIVDAVEAGSNGNENIADMEFDCEISGGASMPDSFKDPADANLLNMEPLKITARNITLSQGQLVSIGTLKIDFVINYGDSSEQQYRMSAEYRYGPSGGSGSEWSFGKYYNQ